RAADAGGYGLDAQWSDDFHHSVHALLTGEKEGYYEDFGGIWHLERSLRDVFVYDGRYSRHRRRRHGAPVSETDASRFVVCIQNHDQIGNRMNGDRLASLVSFDELKVAAGLLLLSPYTPLIFMGEEMAETNPFLYFTSHSDQDLVEAVREGRKAEFSSFSWKGEPPDPDDPNTFRRSRLDHSRRESGDGAVMFELYRKLIELRRSHPALRETDRRMVEVSTDGTRLDLLRRSGTGEDLLIRFNLGEREIDRPANLAPVFDSDDPRWASETGSSRSESRIAPHSFVVFRTGSHEESGEER
ncbi:MAG: DUF3459 domain-containing protein, partial [Thermoanaerobaculia bacterium]|nr:DUF3459 domain-containing protein [Thermoanaerobaculia bacterium]